MYTAYKNGRAEKDPSEFWYKVRHGWIWQYHAFKYEVIIHCFHCFLFAKGEIGFFDFYVIPLAKKLKDCGVFGVSSAEYLRYAEQNRKEWEARGQDMVASFMEKIQQPRRSSETNGNGVA